jgi:cell shape-determining protein MreC
MSAGLHFGTAAVRIPRVAILRSRFLFYGLMGLSFITAFVLPAVYPAKFASAGLPQLQGIFAPVSRPARALAGWVYNRTHRPVVVDDRSPEAPRSNFTVYEENHQLLTALASLQIKLDQLSQLNADRQSLGDIRPLCKPAIVTGSEVSGLREGLTLSVGSTSLPLVNRPVIRGNPSLSPLPCDLIGRIVRSGPAGAQVRLVTDPGFVLTARIGRYVTQPDGKLQMVYDPQIHPLVRGIGSNQMAIQSTLSMQQVHDGKVQKGDTVVLDDHDDWPLNVQGFAVGRIVSINPQQNAPLFADIRIEPQTNLMRLTEVMVMVKD